MAEVVFGALIDVLIEKTVSWSGQYMRLDVGEGIHDRMKKWSDALRKIRAVLKDAEQQQLTKEEAKLWLDDLHDLAYDIEDVVDELAIQEMTTTARTSGNMLDEFAFMVEGISGRRLRLDDEMNTKIKDISRRLEDIFERKRDLGLNSINVVVGERVEALSRETTSLPPSRVIGRDKEEEEIVEMLMKLPEPDSAEVPVITILGMGGMGKTTLAQHVYQDKQVEGFFDLRAWVCVSDVFDVVGITKTILKSIDCRDKIEKLKLNQLQEKLEEMLSRKKFLVVLDDIWNEKHGEWEQLLRPFHSGAAGSKILATTRNESVASAISLNNSHYNLKYLGDNHCLSLLALHALGKDDFSQHPHLKGSAEQIVKKCGRLPLAIKTVAGLLRCKPQRQWEDVINSNTWTEDSNGILPALRLSYYHLPSHLKRCFAYCSIIPKDYIFDKNELILLWMAEGFLEQPAGGYKIRVEDFGNDCFQELLSRSFFQLTGESTTEFIMHDLINDLAVYVAGERSFRMDDKWDKNQEYKISERTRHLSFISRQYDEVSNKFDVFSIAHRSRTFLPLSPQNYPSHFFSSTLRIISNTHLALILSRLQSLRVLNLRAYDIVELPNTIGAWKHLRYLNLSYTKIKQLPQFVCSLYNLQTLSLNECESLSELPSSIGCLTNLRHLDLAETPALWNMPSGIGKLTSLQTLSKITVGRDTRSCNLKHLKDLRNLHGTLSIEELQNVTDDRDAVAADLRSKGHLEILKLKWDYWKESASSALDKQMLVENLQPHCNLKELEIEGYGGVEFPSWVGGQSMSNVVRIHLFNCSKITHLPPLGELPRLCALRIYDCRELEKLPNGLHGLASLQVMRISGCPSLVWDVTDWLPKSLIHLTLSNCTKSVHVLSNLGFNRLTSLQTLTIGGFEDVVSFEKVVGGGDSNSTSTSTSTSTSYLFPPSLTELFIDSFPNLESLSNSLQNLTSLRWLRINNCPKLESLAGADDDEASLQIISSLHKLSIYYCPEVKKRCEVKTGKYWPTIQHIPQRTVV